MRRFVSSELGSLDNFMFEEVASPIPKHREVRIKVEAVALPGSTIATLTTRS